MNGLIALIKLNSRNLFSLALDKIAREIWEESSSPLMYADDDVLLGISVENLISERSCFGRR